MSEFHLFSGRLSALTLSAIAAAVLVACGGGNSPVAPDTPVDTNAYVLGTAAYGAAMAKASITVRDATGKTVTVISDDNGDYKATITGFTAPLLITASANSGDAVRTYHAVLAGAIVASSSSRANVTPLTEAITAMASSDGKSPEEFIDATKLAALDPAKLTKAIEALKAIIKDVASDLGAVGFDPLTSVFKADRSSPGDKLLDTIKVTVGSGGVSLRNIAVPLGSADAGAPASAVITISDVKTQTATALPKPVISDSGGLIDAWVAQVNKCLSLAPTARVSVDATGAPTAFLGDCNTITNFSSNYKRNGYTLLQYWGKQLHDIVPEGAVLSLPEVLAFLKNSAGEDLALVRFSYTSPKGAGVYFEIARKIGATWVVEGNQRHYDASVSFTMYRSTDRSTNNVVPSAGPDKGKNVGSFGAYFARLNVSFNQSGPNGADVYAVRVKGPGFPAAGVVMTRSTACGTSDYLAAYSNDGSLPAAPAPGAVFARPTGSTSNGYIVDIVKNGNGYTGSDFYNEFRGRNADGAPSTSRFSFTAPTAVDVSTIPELAAYTFEVFKVGASVAADSFIARNVARPQPAVAGLKMPWASFSADSLKYVDPAGGLAGELSGATLAWSVPEKTANVTSAYLFGTGLDSAVPPVNQSTLFSQSVKALGDTSLALVASAKFDGNGNACTYAKVPAFSATSGSRQIGLRRPRVDGVLMQQTEFHNGRPAVP